MAAEKITDVKIARPNAKKVGDKDTCLECGKEYTYQGRGMLCENCRTELAAKTLGIK